MAKLLHQTSQAINISKYSKYSLSEAVQRVSSDEQFRAALTANRVDLENASLIHKLVI